jgi:transposase
MKIKQTIGIDISKLTFDVRIHINQMYAVFNNDQQGFQQMIKWVNKNNPFSEHETLFVFEHTGLYSHQLAVFLTDHHSPFSLVPGLEIKRSLGISRGKDDKIDAKKIAKYAFEKREEIQTYEMPSEQISLLKRLLSLRVRLVKQRAGYKASLKEQKRILIRKENKVLFESQERIIKYLTKQIDAIEKEMDDIINKDDSLKAIYKLIVSIKSVGHKQLYL